jgi:hypothetical protein
MNYFNYFTEIEDTFIRRRGKHLLLSPMDWALIESWKEMGVPLHVALRGIERSFDSFESKPRRRTVKSLLYCQEEVEAQFAEWQEAQVGAANSAKKKGERVGTKEAGEAGLPFPRAAIVEHLEHARQLLRKICDQRKKTRKDDFCDALSRAAARLKELEEDFARAARPSAEKLEESLTNLEKMLDAALREHLTARELAKVRAEAEEQLQPYRGRMEQTVFEQTLNNLVFKRLRETHGLPRLSLFYL